MIRKDWLKFCFIFNLIGLSMTFEDSNSSSVYSSEVYSDDSTKVLSRRKRFLVFPDGSSFQLVICTQNHGYLQLGDIIWFGNTAALAWELPTDPTLFQYFIRSGKNFLESSRRHDEKHIVYLDENGRVVSKVPYRRKFIVNPAFAKRSLDITPESNAIRTVSKKSMHEAQKNKSLIQTLDDSSLKFHRNGRLSLYGKIDKFLEGLGWSGKECLLRMLCEHGKPKNEQGSFLQEIMKATFTFPRHPTDQIQDYDKDHSANEDCAALYPECEDEHGVLFQSDTLNS